MAIYHLSNKMISRSSRNTVRALAYRAGCAVKDQLTGETFTYAHKEEVKHVELVLPEDAPDWSKEVQDLVAKDRQAGVQKLSDIVEAAERRCDAQVYRELEFALPREFTDEQKIALAREFLQDQCGKLGIGVLANFHFDVDEEGGEKPHCHALLLTRKLTEEGLHSKKERAWNTKEQHEIWREQWAAYVNFHLKMHGFDQRIDHRSHLERGIEVEPQPKRGTNVHNMEIRLGQDPRDIFSASTTAKAIAYKKTKLRNACRIIKKPEIVLDIVSKHQSTFMWGNIETVLARYIDDPDVYLRLEHKLKNSPELVLLRVDTIKQQDGSGIDHAIYTTRKMIEAEVNLVHRAEKLSQAKSHEVKPYTVQTIIAQFDQKLKEHGGLSADQKNALHHITLPYQLSCIVGYAGAGKTTALEAAKEMWEVEGYRVYGLAPTGRASQNLEQSGISSQTLHKFLKSFNEGRCHYSSKTVLVLDEAGMVDTQRFEAFLRAVHELGVKAVVVGDGAQLQPVQAGPAFRLVTEKVGSSRLERVIRQKEAWQQEATKLFGTLKTRQALQVYQDKGYINFIEEHKPSIPHLIQQKNHNEIVKAYNLSRRMVGNIYHTMLEDLKEQNPLEKQLYKLIRFHQDYERYKEWRDIKAACAEHMMQNLESCRAFMKELGVDPFKFAEQFVDKHQSLKEQKQEAASLARDWQLPSLDPHQRPHVCELRKATKKALIEEWYSSFKENPQKSHLIMTYGKADTAALNEEARMLMKKEGIISKEAYLHTIQKEDEDDFGSRIITKQDKHFAVGDRLLFMKNENRLGVRNGTLGTILEVDKSKIKAKLDGSDKVVSFAPKLYPTFDYGWAANIHKAQGVTVDRSYLLATHETYRNLAYVAMTRHQDYVKVFGSKLDFWREEIFTKRLSASHEKLAAHDYKNDQNLYNMPSKNSRIQQILNKLGNELEALKFVTKESWNSIAQRFLSQTPKAKEIRIPQTTLSEEIRASELFEKNESYHLNQPILGKRKHSHDFKDQLSLKNTVASISYYRREDVLRSLSRADIESLFQTYINLWVEKPKMTKLGNQLRFGSKGGFVINLDTGQWYSHYHGEGGDIFSFLSRTQKIPYAQAIRELGQRSKTRPSSYQLLAPTEEKLKAWEETQQAEEIIKLKAAHLKIQKLYEKSQVIQGTIAEQYLREHRHIKEAELPSHLRFMSAYKDPNTNTFYPALVAFARNAHGKVCAAQITYLDPITGNKANVDVKKRSQGIIKGSAVEIQKGEGVTYVVEGIETALSLKEAKVEGRILATLGLSNIANVSPHLKNKQEPIILVGDADTPQSAPWKTSLKAVHTLKMQGYSITLIRPKGENGRDFNDVLQEEGVTALKTAFNSIPNLKENFAHKQTKTHLLKEQIISHESRHSTEAYEKEKLQDLSQTLDPTTQRFLKENPNVSLETLKKWDQEFEVEKKAYLSSMASSKGTPSEISQSLTLSDVVSNYQHLKWKLDNIRNPQRLAEAEKAMESLVINAHKDPQLIKMLQIRHKDIANDLKTKHLILIEQQLYARGPTLDL